MEVLAQGALVKVVGVQSNPQLNGTFVRLLRQLRNGRWETQGYSNPAQEAALRPENLAAMPPLTRQLFHYLSEESLAELYLEAHANELPLLYLATWVRLRDQLELELGKQASGREKLEALRQAAAEPAAAPQAYSSQEQIGASDASVRGPHEPAVVMLRIPACASELPSLEHVPRQPGYLHVLATALGATAVQIVPLAYKGQVAEQPLLYVDPEQCGAAGGARNALASALCGAEVWGDALLASAELKLRDRDEMGRPVASARRVSIGDLETRLAKRVGGAVGFIGFKYSRVLLGAWAVPRAGGDVGAGRQRDRRFVEGARAWEAAKGPRAILHEYCQDKSARSEQIQWHIHTDSVHDADAENATPPFVGRVDFGWAEGLPLPAGARQVQPGWAELACEPCPTKKGAENAAAVALLGALQALEPTDAPLQFLEMRPPAIYALAAELVDAGAAAAAATDVAAINELRGTGAPADELHCDGTTLIVSVRLARLEKPPAEDAPRPLPWAALPPEEGGGGGSDEGAADGGSTGGGVISSGGLLLEELRRVPVLLGGKVVAVAVEELLRATAARTEAACHVRVRYHGVPCWCVLHARVHEVEPSPEQRAVLTGGTGPGGHNDERLSFVSRLVRQWGHASLMDVGCGQGKLPVRLVQDGAFVDGCVQLVGLEPDPKPSTLRRAAERVAAALAGEVAAGRATPSVQLYRGSLEDAWRVRPRCEVVTMVEVVEHLDPPQLAAVGDVLLRRVRPRRLVVTTPNKEYNLNLMTNPNTEGTAPTAPPPLATYPLRNADHRFEWTRLEFRQWAAALAQEHSYSVQHYGVGGGPLDEEPVHGEWRGVGPVTQVAVFELIPSSSASSDTSSAAASVAAGPAFDDGSPLQQVWSSEETHALPCHVTF